MDTRPRSEQPQTIYVTIILYVCIQRLLFSTLVTQELARYLTHMDVCQVKHEEYILMMVTYVISACICMIIICVQCILYKLELSLPHSFTKIIEIVGSLRDIITIIESILSKITFLMVLTVNNVLDLGCLYCLVN